MGLADIEKQILKEAEAAAKKSRFENKEEIEQLDKLHQEKLVRLKKNFEHETLLEAERASRPGKKPKKPCLRLNSKS